MYKFEGSIFVNRPPQDVFNAMTDLSKQPLWQTSLESIELTSAGPADVGSTMKAVSKMLGRRIETEMEITAYDPPHGFSFKSIGGSYPVEVTNKLEPQNDGTLLTYKGQAEFGGFFKLAEGLVGKQIINQVDTQNENFKLLMESNQL